MPRTIIRFILHHRIPILVCTAIGTLLAGFLLTTLIVDNDTSKTVPPDLEAKLRYRELQDMFPAPFNIVCMVQFDSTHLSENIDSIRAWGKKFTACDGIESAVHIASLHIPQKGGFFGIRGSLLVPPDSKATSEEIRQRLQENSEFVESFISDDESIFSMILVLSENADEPATLDTVFHLAHTIEQHAAATFFVTSERAVSRFINSAMRRDLRVLLPLCLGVIFILLYGVFRRIPYVLSSLIVISIALIWTFGLMGLTGTPLSIVSAVIPVILFPIGVADSIHIIKTFSRFVQNGYNPEEGLYETYQELMRPVVLTTITTAVGFGSFALSDISWTRNFGMFTAIGVVFALVFTILLLPILLSFVKYPGHTPAETPGLNQTGQGTERVWSRIRSFLFESRIRLLGLLCVLIVCISGLMRITVESNPIAMLSPSSELRVADKMVERYFGGTRFFSVVLFSDTPFTTANQWHDIDGIVSYCRTIPEVGNVQSLVPLVHKVGEILSNEPFSQPAITLLFSSKSLFSSGFAATVARYISADRTKVRFTVVCQNDPSIRYGALADSIAVHIKEHYPHYRVMTAGPALLIDSMISVIIHTQISSLILTLVSVLLVLCLLFRSLRTGLFTMAPIVLSTMFVYALMGIFDVAVNTVTVVIVNTCVGIGIDYAIHFVSGYTYTLSQQKSKSDALMDTMKNKGMIIIANTLVVGIGFLILTISEFPPIREFGLFVFLSMVVSCVFALTLLPVLLSHVPRQSKSIGAGLEKGNKMSERHGLER